MTSRLWIAWEIQRRNRTASHALGAPLLEIDVGGHRLSRYLKSAWRTLKVLYQESPQIVIAQSPSIFLAVLAVVYGKVVQRFIVIDAHNAAIDRLPERNILGAVSRWVFREANLTVVTNEGLASKVEKYGGRVAILPDPLPNFSRPKRMALEGVFNVLFICTWANDEPFEDVIRAAYRIPREIYIYITGNSRGREAIVGEGLPPNVMLTGFVPEEEFEGLLHSVDAVMDLTSREDCLLCGAYEAVSAERPLILSDTFALRDYFDEGALFTDNTEAHIAKTIMEARDQYADLQVRIRNLKKDMPTRWNTYLRMLEAQLDISQNE